MGLLLIENKSNVTLTDIHPSEQRAADQNLDKAEFCKSCPTSSSWSLIIIKMIMIVLILIMKVMRDLLSRCQMGELASPRAGHSCTLLTNSAMVFIIIVMIIMIMKTIIMIIMISIAIMIVIIISIVIVFCCNSCYRSSCFSSLSS